MNVVLCKAIELAIALAPDGSEIEAKLQALHDEYCGGTVHTNDGGGGGDPKPPK